MSYSSICISPDQTIYALGALGTSGERVFKEVKLDDTETRRELVQNNSHCIAFPSTHKLLFAGTDNKEQSSGTVKCYKFPSTQHMEEFLAHDNLGIEKICVSSDDKYLISAGRDGCVIVFEIRDK